MPTQRHQIRVDGAAIVYRLYDVGYAIRLEQAVGLLAPAAPERLRPVRGEAQAIQIANPPVSAPLGKEPIVVCGVQYMAELSVRIFDFGVCSLSISINAKSGMQWSDFSAFGTEIDTTIDLTGILDRYLGQLTTRINSAIDRPRLAPVTEDYVLFRITKLKDADGNPLAPEVLRDEDIIPLLLNERRPLAAAARMELLPHRFSYYEDDLTILTWDNALVIEPSEQDTDIQYILEFANAQLLELRVYDSLLDAELPAMYERVATVRSRWVPFTGPAIRRILATLHTRFADVTEPVERIENALKVTDDVYLARVYSSALEIFRAGAWRQGIYRKLGIIRGTYEMLNTESQAARSELLEIMVVLLIIAELVLAIMWKH